MDAGDADRLKAAAQRLRVDYATAEVLRALADAGIPTLLLKGASIVRWLYESGGTRSYADGDLLVPPARFDDAGAVLAGLGFEPELEETDMPDWWREHGVCWYRSDDSVEIDLHRTVAGLEADPERVWERLSERTEPIEIAGFEARALAIPGRALHLALHAAQHGAAGRHAQELELALGQTDEATWRAAAELARDLDGVDAFGTGLRLAPSGSAMAARLELGSDRSAKVALQAAGFVEGTLTLDRFASSGLGTRASILRYKLAPPPTFMRKWSPLARRGKLGLALAYLWRPLWVLCRMPRAMRQWRDARRAP